MKIPFNRPFIAGKELYYIARAVFQGHLSGNGPFTKKCQEWMETKFQSPKILLTHSGTGALEMAAILSNIGPGDEVIMPSFTFVSTANAFVLRGAVPVFVDIRFDSLNIDEDIVAQAITEKTKAVVPVHYAGFACEMETIMALANQHDLWVIEDAAQGMLSKYQDQYLGSIGHLGVLSFHETKNIISGEGGALLVNSPELVDRAEVIWEKGTNRKQFFDGRVDKYTWLDIGSSFLPSEIVGAFLWAQIEQAEKIVNTRCQIFRQYQEMLSPLVEKGYIQTPPDHLDCANNGHIFYVITESFQVRTKLLQFLKKESIHAVFHYLPLHSSPAGQKYGRVCGQMTNTDEVTSRILRLPMFYEISDHEVSRVVQAVYRFFRVI
ncbi:MAG: dTDP-4-amino-4,6-dideoxygalactose transaminase [Desulfovermiculus sp.]|nr:dTDP-4-amino-4,6-dideoxygalactose transaminase [Desulfovermiculus sp.]